MKTITIQIRDDLTRAAGASSYLESHLSATEGASTKLEFISPLAACRREPRARRRSPGSGRPP